MASASHPHVSLTSPHILPFDPKTPKERITILKDDYNIKMTPELVKEVRKVGSLSQALIDYTRQEEQLRAWTFASLVRSGVPDEEAAKKAGYDPKRDPVLFEAISRSRQNSAVLQP